MRLFEDSSRATAKITMKSYAIASAIAILVAATSLSGAPTPVPSGRASSAPLDPTHTPEGLSDSDWSGIRGAYERNRHAIVANPDGTYQARNPGQRWMTRFDARGFTVTPDAGGWSWGLELVGYGGRTFVSAGPGDETDKSVRTPLIRNDGTKVSYLRDDYLTEWFINDSRGLEQGWTLAKRPEHADSAGPLRLQLAVRGSLRPHVSASGGSVAFLNESGGAALTYGELKAWDADGKTVPARFAKGQTGNSTLCIVVDDAAATYPITIDPIVQQAYLKASNTDGNDQFGSSVAVAGDTVVVGAPGESSNATGVNGNQANNGASNSGAAYIFIRSGGIWTQQAYLKASNSQADDYFGISVAVSGDTVVVGANGEDSNATGVNGNQGDNNLYYPGAAYVFIRTGSTWTQQAYLKASNTGNNDVFGTSVAVAGDTVVVGAPYERSNATGVNGNQADNSLYCPGAAYVFVRSGGIWSQQAYLKASNTDAYDSNLAYDYFGCSVAASGDTVVVGAYGESSNGTGVNGNQGNNSAHSSGAAYVFIRSGGSWTQQAYLKASNTDAADHFGCSVAISGDTVVVGAYGEASYATGVNGNQADNSGTYPGAAYIFIRNGAIWTQQVYLKASNAGYGQYFGSSVAVSGDTVVIGAYGEASSATGVNGNQGNNWDNHYCYYSGAAYVLNRRGGIWTQQAYLKASNSNAYDYFGCSVAVSGDTVVVGANQESSDATGVNGSQANNYASYSGGAYVFAIVPAPEINVEQSAGTGLIDGSSEIFFGSVIASTALTFTVRNDGTADLTDLAIAVDGANAADFAVNTAGMARTLTPGATTTFTVTFTPGAMGWRSAALHIVSNDSTKNPFDILLAGTSPAPDISVSVPESSVPLANTGTLSLGTVPAGLNTISTTFTISNEGDKPLTGLVVSKDGVGSGDFQIDTTGMATSLEPGENTTFSVNFNPVGFGNRSAALHIASNDPDENPFDVMLEWVTIPPNDAFADRIDLGTVAAATVTGSVELTSSQVREGEPDISDFAMWGEEDDFTVWYAWTAPAGTQWGRIELSGPSVPTVVSVYTGSNLDSLTRVALQRYGDPQAPDYLSFQATPGTTYVIRVAVWALDYWLSSNDEDPTLGFTLALSSIGSPATAGDYVFCGRAWLEKGTRTGLANALAGFNSAVALDASHEEARFLRALTRLMNLEAEPAFVNLLDNLDIYRSGLLLHGGQVYFPLDSDGIIALPSGASTTTVFAWVDAELLPRLASIRADLDLITSDNFRTRLSVRETGAAGALVDKGDVLVVKAITHGVEMLFQLLFTYNLNVSVEAAMMLELTGRLDAQGVLASVSSLLEFATTDRRPQFAAALRAMDEDYRAASDFIRTQRGDPNGLITERLSTDPAGEAKGRDTLAAAVASLDGEVTYQGVRVNLSRLVVTNMSIRGWLPQLRGDEVVGGTFPDPTLDGILPGMSQQNAEDLIYKIGRLWGYAQYVEEYGDVLKSMGFAGLPNDDADGDGNSNFLEWLRGSNPIEPNVVWQDFTREVLVPGKAEVRISFARRMDLRDWKLVVAVSDDLAKWDRTEAQVERVGDPIDNGDGWSETVTYRLTDAAALADRKFLRVEALPK